MRINKILLFSHFIVLFKLLKCYIVYPLKILEKDNYLESLLSFNSTYTFLEMGTPPQNVTFFFNMSHNQINITDKGCINKHFFNKNASTSFLKRFELDPSDQDINTKYLVTDKLYFYKYLNLTEKLTITDYPFFYSSNISDNDINLCGNIGLSSLQYGMYDFESKNIKEYTKNLKDLGAGKYTDFSFFYYKNQDFLIFDTFLTSEFPDLFKDIEHISWIHPAMRIKDSKLYWEISMKDIYYNNVHSKEFIRCELNPLFELILGTNEFKNNITKDYFKTYINKKICSMVEYKDYHIFECNQIQFTNNDIKKFPTLHFLNLGAEYIFKLQSEDLFVKLNNKLYFKIVFPINDLEVERWILGRSFMRKYTIQFSPFSKLIGFYLKREEEIKNEGINDNNSKNKWIIIICIFMVMIALIFVGVGLYLGKKLFYSRKKRANELLDDDYQYDSQINKENKNNNNEIISDNPIN